MKLDRRDFLKMVGTVVPAWGLIPIANAQSSLYSGKVIFNIHADGGLDASSWTDPRETDPLMNDYARNGVPAAVAGAFRVAPMGNNPNFFNMYSRNILVINGVNTENNDHGQGTMAHATGSLEMGYPNLGELFARQFGDSLSLSWLAQGGYTMSAGLLPATPVPDANTFRALTSPNQVNATQDFMKASDLKAAFETRAARMEAIKASGKALPRQNMLADQFLASDKGRATMDRVASLIPATFDRFASAQVALIAVQAGLTSAVELETGGFDAHGDITNTYAQSLPRLTDLLDYLMQKSAALNVADRVIFRVYSEFGRSPLNSGNGKDHHPVGSQLIMAPTAPWGNRVVGASGPRHEQLKINVQTGAVDPVNGVVIKPRHIHASLRKFLGITNVDPRFDLKVPASEQFDFFNTNLKTPYVNM